MPGDAASSYDELPYSDRCFPATHPDHLSVVARLHGLVAPAVASCRVLELGCAQGGNLLPMAYGLPSAQFVGVDLSARQIAAARETAAAIGLKNIDLRAMSIGDIGGDLGTFDFIICHGVYSWVPPEIQDKILAVAAASLAPSGVAYISYNTYPGWHARGLVREILGYRVRRFGDAAQRIGGARSFLDELLRVLPDREGSYARILNTEAEYLRRSGDDYLFHEHLEDTNQPCYFHEFAALAAAVGLAPLAEAQDAVEDQLPPEAAAALDNWSGDEIERQQYLDILINRTFRRTLLCHAVAHPAAADPFEAVQSCLIRATAWPVADQPDVTSQGVESFRGETGAALETAHPVVKTALVALCEAWPHAVPYAALRDRTREVLAGAGDAVAEILPTALVRCFRSGLVGLHHHPARFAGEPGDHPRASALARLQAQRGCVEITNLRHRTVKPRAFDRAVLGLLDGRRDHAALLDELAGLAARGEMALEGPGGIVEDEELICEALRGELEPSLARLARGALLESGD